MERRTPLWLSHHFPNEYDRCVKVGRTHLCRRCSVFWPACFAAMLLALAGLRWPESLDAWLLWLLPVPVVTEWWLEQLGIVRYSAARNTVFTLICAPAVGVGLARYALDPTDSLFWVVVATYAVICLIPVFIGRRVRTTAEAGAATRRAAGSARCS